MKSRGHVRSCLLVEFKLWLGVRLGILTVSQTQLLSCLDLFWFPCLELWTSWQFQWLPWWHLQPELKRDLMTFFLLFFYYYNISNAISVLLYLSYQYRLVNIDLWVNNFEIFCIFETVSMQIFYKYVVVFCICHVLI